MLARIKYWKKRLLITAKGTLLVCCGPKIRSRFQKMSLSTLVQLKPVKKCLARDKNLKKNGENYQLKPLKGCVLTVPNGYIVEQPSDKECYLPHHPVFNLNKPGVVRRVLNSAANFRRTSLKNICSFASTCSRV